MGKKFIAFDNSDKRVYYASSELERLGYHRVDRVENADFALFGVNPERSSLSLEIPCYAGNIGGNNIFDYTKNEAFAIENAYLTAEGAIALATDESERSLINSSVLITGYGRIGRALHRYLDGFTNDITICARSNEARTLAASKGAKTIDFEGLKGKKDYDFIFNTVPHPVFNEQELSGINEHCLLLELASFPGGVDRHLAKHKGVKLIIARSLPAKYSPKSAGEAVAHTVDTMMKEGV